MEGPSKSSRDIYRDEADTRKALQIPTQGSEMSGVPHWILWGSALFSTHTSTLQLLFHSFVLFSGR